MVIYIVMDSAGGLVKYTDKGEQLEERSLQHSPEHSVPINGVHSVHFVLIHGGSHGAWCWYKVATRLKSEGHNVTTIELAASGINPKQVQEIMSISEYYEPLMTFLASLPPKEKVILVGHSVGGLSTSVAMEKFPEKISVAVFVTAYVRDA
ncbi:methyl jasmonate esterase 1-like [Lotus japonicus]|uniref:methyl jasmonate esterase 1-like n=1 Tax=Lotus japonicus TaxID=34305 RepID=UPI002584E409|nr:methyl jasmonate esterase 1-like [Lotus japonicus]